MTWFPMRYKTSVLAVSTVGLDGSVLRNTEAMAFGLTLNQYIGFRNLALDGKWVDWMQKSGTFTITTWWYVWFFDV